MLLIVVFSPNKQFVQEAISALLYFHESRSRQEVENIFPNLAEGVYLECSSGI